ncbi:DUF1676 domain-containing protein Osi23 [Megalopta genalis]|uniref:DUF1676 domain-containing protein Osi23 n=1 Tax=Megalopta genalis TaxID=115081 RepID=UPI0014435C11|nr:uncharacterized protein LOC117224095 [Megalopta genalis]
MLLPMWMHPRAFYVFALVPIALGHADVDGKTRWYHSLSAVIRDCPYQSWRNVGQDDFFEKYRKCVQERALVTLDLLLADDVIPIVDGLDLVRFPDIGTNSTEEKRTDSNPVDDSKWTGIIVKRILSVLRTHVFKVDVDHLSGYAATLPNNSKPNNSIFEGRRRRNRRRHNHMVPLLMMGFVLMGSILIPMGFQFLAVLGGKALLLAKMALILSSIQGLKKIATNGVNYGLYHTPVDHGWHDRSHLEPNSNVDHLPFPLQYRP